jgi:CheY-like chemotaxis protein
MSRLVLVVDDSDTIRELICLNLEFEGYDVEQAADAQVCLDRLDAVRTQGLRRPDMLLLDVVMPGLDGFKLTTRIKGDPSTADIPIMIVSASAQQRDFELARQARADGYLTKPFDPDTLIAKVRDLAGPPLD